MARGPRLTKLLSVLSGQNVPEQITKLAINKPAPKAKTISAIERRDLLSKAVMRSKAEIRPGRMSFKDYTDTISKDQAAERIENERIMKMAPEISQAASIMIPSIVSPVDLTQGTISVICNAKCLTEQQRTKISDLVTGYFEDNLHLSTKIPEWIHTALYQSGSKPLVVIPTKVLADKLQDEKNIITGAVEQFNRYHQISERQSLFGFADPVRDMSADIDRVTGATESLNHQLVIGLRTPHNIVEQKHKIVPEEISQKYSAFVKDVLSTEKLNVLDNPHTVELVVKRNKSAKKKISKAVDIMYRQADLQIWDKPDPDDDVEGEPIIFEPPSESVIPIYTPGTPSDHIGYFILLDDRGCPLSIQDYGDYGQNYQSAEISAQNNNFNQLFQAYGFNDSPINTGDGQDVVASIYQNIVESHLKQRAAQAGFGDVGLGSTSSIFQYMFTRYMTQRKTKILFLPKEFVTYLCYKHNEHGIGVSKLDEVKYILSLRITLMTCRMLSAFNQSIERKKISIDYPNDFAGDVYQHMRMVQREVLRKNAVSFTTDPMNISQQVADKSYTIKPNNIPGLNGYTIDVEPTPTNPGSTIDNELAEDLKQLLILNLDVPASAMNALGQDEYSRSVATTNLFFARKILNYQNLTAHHVDDYLFKYAAASADLRAKIISILTQDPENGTKKTTKDGGTVDSKSEPNKNLLEVLQSLHLSLPPPNIAPTTSQFDTIDKLIQSLDTLLTSVVPDDLGAGNPDAAQSIPLIRATVKSNIIKKMLKDTGFSHLELPDLAAIDAESIMDYRHKILNIGAMLRSQNEALNVGSTSDLPGQADGDLNPATTGMDENYSPETDAVDPGQEIPDLETPPGPDGSEETPNEDEGLPVGHPDDQTDGPEMPDGKSLI